MRTVDNTHPTFIYIKDENETTKRWCWNRHKNVIVVIYCENTSDKNPTEGVLCDANILFVSRKIFLTYLYCKWFLSEIVGRYFRFCGKKKSLKIFDEKT